MNTGAPAEINLILIVVVSIVVFALLARMALHLFLRVHVAERIGRGHDAALGIEYAGYFLGVLLIAGSVLDGIQGAGEAAGLSSGDWSSLIQAGAYGLFGIIALALFGRLGFRFLVRSDIVAGVRANNPAAGVVAAGGHVSTALVIAGALSGDSAGGDFITALVFVAIGLMGLWGVTYAHRFITSYDDATEITNGNVAAALSYAGMMVAIGIIVGHAINGDFTDYSTALRLCGRALLAVLILYPVRQFIVQGILVGGGFRLYGGKLDDEISRDGNVGTGAVEAASYIAAALLALQVGF